MQEEEQGLIIQEEKGTAVLTSECLAAVTSFETPFKLVSKTRQSAVSPKRLVDSLSLIDVISCSFIQVWGKLIKTYCYL